MGSGGLILGQNEYWEGPVHSEGLHGAGDIRILIWYIMHQYRAGTG